MTRKVELQQPRGRGLAGALCAVALLGCQKQPPASKFPSGADALARMKATYACANGVQGEGKIDHLGERGRVRGEVAMFAINAARVRIDVLNPFAGIVFTVTSDGNNFKMNDVAQKQFLHGPASACNLARLTRVPMPGHALVYLMRGEAPLLVLQRPGEEADHATSTRRDLLGMRSEPPAHARPG